MKGMDMIHDATRAPVAEDIEQYMNQPARLLWEDFNYFIQDIYKTSPKIDYSKCSAKPGWNVKYKKTGKSLCTLYPEKDRFIALIVVTLGLVPVIEGMASEFEPEVMQVIKSTKPLNGTLWLMLAVENEASLGNIKKLLLMKQPSGR